MNIKITLATTRRILSQLRHDKRTIGLMVVVPSLLMILLRYVFDQRLVFDHIGPALHEYATPPAADARICCCRVS